MGPFSHLVDFSLWRVDEIFLFFGAVAAFLACIEVCFRLGRRHGTQASDIAAQSHVMALQAALLGLLALLLGFNFAMAASRFDARKTLIQDEVNAINTTYLRSQLQPPAYRQQYADLLRAFIASRIAFMNAGIDEGSVEQADANASRIEAQLWALTQTMLAQEPSSAATQPFINSMNEMVNVTDKRRAALDNHVPEPVIDLLFIVALGAIGFIAYGYGLSGERRHGTTAIFAILIALVLTTILDLDRPRRGFIRVGEESLLRLQAALARERS